MYNIRFSKDAGKYIKKLDRVTKERIRKSLLQLAVNSYQSNLDVKKLSGYENSFRLRIGKYRALYKIYEDEVIIFVFDVNSRGDIYK